jgi:tetratricopeptide (TPR) repeat protein
MGPDLDPSGRVFHRASRAGAASPGLALLIVIGGKTGKLEVAAHAGVRQAMGQRNPARLGHSTEKKRTLPMRPRLPCRLLLAVVIATPACHRDSPQAPGRPGPASFHDQIPAAALDAVLAAHLRGLGHMERFEYDQAAAAFREVHRLAPGWTAGSINLAIALLNQTGNEGSGATASAAGGGPSPRYQEALGLLDAVLAREPANLAAHYCRGMILEDLGELERAHRDFLFVAERDPADAHAWFKVGSTMTDPDRPDRPAGPNQAARLIEVYSKALTINPNLVSALYKLQAAYGWAGDRDRQKELIRRWQELDPKSNPAGPGDPAGTTYGEMGRYARIVNPLRTAPGDAQPARFPRFSLPPATLAIELPAGCRWVKATDFEGPRAVIGRARARFGAAVAAFDADGDGKLDLYLCSAVIGPRGIRDTLLINRGAQSFRDATREYGLDDDQASLGVAAGDFDADGLIDLFLTGVGSNRLYRNGGGRFRDVTQQSGIVDVAAVSLTARWLDLDQDGDLDLYVVNHAAAEEAEVCFAGRFNGPTGMRNAAYRNDGKAPPVEGRPPSNWAPVALAPADLAATAGLSLAFTPWPDAEALLGEPAPQTAIAALDVDDDRDLDLVLAADGQPLRAVLNDRLGRFHTVAMPSLTPSGRHRSLLVTDLDKDGRGDLVGLSVEGAVTAWRNASGRSANGAALTWETWPVDCHRWACAVATDLDLDTWPDLVGLELGPRGAAVLCGRNEATRLVEQMPWGRPEPGSEAAPSGFGLVDLVGDPLPDLLLLRDGSPPAIATNRGNGRQWLALALAGRWKAGHDHMRTNNHGLGARVALEGERLSVTYEHTTPEAGLGQGVAPVFLGLDGAAAAALVRVQWPDGTFQCELNVPAGQMLPLVEHNRKTGSCPVLFTWDGERFVCIGDFLGGGGLGYLLAPGVYSQPDRDEAVAIATHQLKATAGRYRLVVGEPMDEVAYLDRLTLDVVDRPPGVGVALDERFAPGGNRPTGQLVAWRRAIEPVGATDLEGRDIAARLRTADGQTVDHFRRLGGWIGYAEEHGIVLDFGDRLASYGPEASLWLALEGWVEYPYSQTNYAAATAGVALRPPVVERRRGDGSWDLVESDAGYPAGLPRLTLLDLSGKLGGDRCVIRLRTNMECYWDAARLVVRDRAAEREVRVTPLAVAGAALGYRGFTRETAVDGRSPVMYDYDRVEPAPLARMAGFLTRYGAVAQLLRADDDRFCVIGPGDEVRLEFDAQQVPPLPAGWTRSYVLRAVGYCKDADPFTATADDVGPLPWRGMPDLPFGPEGERPHDPAHAEFLRRYLIRPAGGR